MRARRVLQLSCLLLFCLFLLSACSGAGPLDTLRVDSPLDDSEITLPIQKGYGQLTGASAYFQTKQTPRELYQAYKALEAEKDWQVTPYPAGLLIEQSGGSGVRYYWLTVSPEHAKNGRNYLLSNMEADLVDGDIWLEDEWTPAGQQGSDAQTPTTGATIHPAALSSDRTGGAGFLAIVFEANLFRGYFIPANRDAGGILSIL